MKNGDVEVDIKINESRGIRFVKFYDKKSVFKAMKDANNLELLWSFSSNSLFK